MTFLSYLKFVRVWFKVSRWICYGCIAVSMFALLVLYNTDLPTDKMLCALALNLGALWFCESGAEVVEERIKEEEKKE